MLPMSLSATALENFVLCPAMFVATNIAKTPDMDGGPAMLGTVCHSVLERWVQDGDYNGSTFTAMQSMYVQEYWGAFDTDEFYEDGLAMLQNWYNRQSFDGLTVVSTEQKLWFPIPVQTDLVWPEHSDPDKFDGQCAPGMPVKFLPFNYIIDRLDMMDDGSPHVVDYKTIRRPMTHEELKEKVQARCYALATAIRYKDLAPEKIWVTFDLLRYESIGVQFTREDNANTWRFLQRRAQQIVDTAAETAVEKINHNCGYCVRRGVCKSLAAHKDNGGIMGIMDDPVAAVDRLAALKMQQKAIKTLVDELQPKVMEYMEAEDATEFTGDTSHVKIRSRRTTVIEDETVKRIVPEHILLEYAGFGTTVVNRMLKDDRLSDEQKSQLKQAMKKIPGTRWLDVQAKTDKEPDAS